MSKPVDINILRGMHNSRGKKSLENPDVIFNMESVEGKLRPRSGYTKIASLTNCNSLYFADKFMLCRADGGSGPALFRIDRDGTSTEIISVENSPELHYLTLDDEVLISGKHWRGRYNKTTQQVTDWGLENPPDAPLVASDSAGRLAPGTYFLCFTRRSSEGNISGPGPYSRVTLTSKGGFSISNKASDYIIWCTEADGRIFYLAGDGSRVNGPLSSQALPTEGVVPPKALKYLTYFGGRVWGARGSSLFYSDPFSLDWFRNFQNIDLNEELKGLAKDEAGLYAFTHETSYFFQDSDLESMRALVVGDGVIEGTVTYLHTGTSGKPMPIWASRTGFYKGEFGNVQRISQDQFHIALREKGASFAFYNKGVPQIGATGPLDQGLGVSDNVEATVIRGGRIVNNEYSEYLRDNFNLTPTTQES